MVWRYVELASGLISYIRLVNGGVTFTDVRPTLWPLLAIVLRNQSLTTKYIN